MQLHNHIKNTYCTSLTLISNSVNNMILFSTNTNIRLCNKHNHLKVMGYFFTSTHLTKPIKTVCKDDFVTGNCRAEATMLFVKIHGYCLSFCSACPLVKLHCHVKFIFNSSTECVKRQVSNIPCVSTVGFVFQTSNLLLA